MAIGPPGYADSAFEPSRISADAGRACIDAASAAITATSAGHHDAVVAAPHHETAIHQAGIAFSGYPSLVARVRGVPEDSVFLMLVGGGLRIVHATLHESVRTALDRLTPELVVAATRAGARACALLALLRTAQAADIAGIRCLLVHAQDDAARQWYES